MRTSKLLAAVVLAAAVGAPVAGFAEDKTMSQSTSTGLRFPFLHGLFTGQTPSQSQLASLSRADEWLNSSPLKAEDLRGKVVLVEFWTFGICWPNSKVMTGFDYIHQVEDRDRAFIVYEAHTDAGKTFRNSEVHTVRNGQLVATTAGWRASGRVPRAIRHGV